MVTTPLPAWPAFAVEPMPLRDGLAHDLPDATIRTDFAQGPARQRSIFRNAPLTVTEVLPVTNDEYEFFQAFQSVVGGGKFTKDIFVNNKYQKCVVNFVKGSVKAKGKDGGWELTYQLETMDKVISSEAEYVCALLLLGYDGDLASFIDLFHYRVHFGWDGA